MYMVDRRLVAVALLVTVVLLPVLAGIQACTPVGPPSGTYKVNTFQFVPTNPAPTADGATPSIWIDTNTKLSGLSGGTLSSSLPGAVMIDYTDSSMTFKTAVVTTVKITYDDDASTEAVELPLRIAAREYESVNSVAGGQIVKSKARVVSGKIPKAITRAAPFRLQMEGYFTQEDGNKLPFKIDQHFDIKTEEAIKSAEEVLQDR